MLGVDLTQIHGIGPSLALKQVAGSKGDPLAGRPHPRWNAGRSLLKVLARRLTAVLDEIGFTSEPLAWSLAGDVEARAELSPVGTLRMTPEPGGQQEAPRVWTWRR